MKREDTGKCSSYTGDYGILFCRGQPSQAHDPHTFFALTDVCVRTLIWPKHAVCCSTSRWMHNKSAAEALGGLTRESRLATDFPRQS